MGKTVTWLHLSDLHVCVPRTGWDAKRVLKTLVADLQKMESAKAYDVIDLLHRFPKKLLVSEYTLMELRVVLSRIQPRERMTAGIDDGKLSLQTTPADQMRRRRELLAELVRSIASVATIVPGENDRVDKAEKLEELVGRAGAESLAIARRSGHVLWAEDMVMGEIAHTELKVRRAWTQSVFFWLQALRNHLKS